MQPNHFETKCCLLGLGVMKMTLLNKNTRYKSNVSANQGSSQYAIPSDKILFFFLFVVIGGNHPIKMEIIVNMEKRKVRDPVEI